MTMTLHDFLIVAAAVFTVISSIYAMLRNFKTDMGDEFKKLNDRIKDEFKKVDDRFERFEHKFEKLEARMSNLENNMIEVKTREGPGLSSIFSGQVYSLPYGIDPTFVSPAATWVWLGFYVPKPLTSYPLTKTAKCQLGIRNWNYWGRISWLLDGKG